MLAVSFLCQVSLNHSNCSQFCNNFGFTGPFNDMQTLKFKAEWTNAFFATVNQMFGGSSYNHFHIVGTRTPYLSRPSAPTRSMLFTNHKAPICKEFGQIVLSNIKWGKAGVCGPTTYDSDCSFGLCCLNCAQ